MDIKKKYLYNKGTGKYLEVTEENSKRVQDAYLKDKDKYSLVIRDDNDDVKKKDNSEQQPTQSKQPLESDMQGNSSDVTSPTSQESTEPTSNDEVNVQNENFTQGNNETLQQDDLSALGNLNQQGVFTDANSPQMDNSQLDEIGVQQAVVEKQKVAAQPLSFETQKEVPHQQRMFDVKNKQHKDLPWVKRYNDGNEKEIKNDNGSVSSHKLSYVEADDKFYVFPTIIEENGELKEFDTPTEAADYAFKTHTAMVFDNEADAKAYSENGLIDHRPKKSSKTDVETQKNEKLLLENEKAKVKKLRDDTYNKLYFTPSGTGEFIDKAELQGQLEQYDNKLSKLDNDLESHVIKTHKNYNNVLTDLDTKTADIEIMTARGWEKGTPAERAKYNEAIIDYNNDVELGQVLNGLLPKSKYAEGVSETIAADVSQPFNESIAKALIAADNLGRFVSKPLYDVAGIKQGDRGALGQVADEIQDKNTKFDYEEKKAGEDGYATNLAEQVVRGISGIAGDVMVTLAMPEVKLFTTEKGILTLGEKGLAQSMNNLKVIGNQLANTKFGYLLGAENMSDVYESSKGNPEALQVTFPDYIEAGAKGFFAGRMMDMLPQIGNAAEKVVFDKTGKAFLSKLTGFTAESQAFAGLGAIQKGTETGDYSITMDEELHGLGILLGLKSKNGLSNLKAGQNIFTGSLRNHVAIDKKTINSALALDKTVEDLVTLEAEARDQARLFAEEGNQKLAEQHLAAANTYKSYRDIKLQKSMADVEEVKKAKVESKYGSKEMLDFVKAKDEMIESKTEPIKPKEEIKEQSPTDKGQEQPTETKVVDEKTDVKEDLEDTKEETTVSNETTKGSDGAEKEKTDVKKTIKETFTKEEPYTTEKGTKVFYEDGEVTYIKENGNPIVIQKTKDGRDKKNATVVKVLDELTKEVSLDNKLTTDVPEGMTPDKIDDYVISESKNPVEVAEVWERLSKKDNVNHEDYDLVEQMMGNVSKKDFLSSTGDKNKLMDTKGKFEEGSKISVAYFRKDGAKVDELAKTLSREGEDNVTTERIAELMHQYPEGTASVRKDAINPMIEDAAIKFHELTGFDISKDMAENISKLEAEIHSKENEVLVKKQAEQLELESEILDEFIKEEAETIQEYEEYITNQLNESHDNKSAKVSSTEKSTGENDRKTKSDVKTKTENNANNDITSVNIDKETERIITKATKEGKKKEFDRVANLIQDVRKILKEANVKLGSKDYNKILTGLKNAKTDKTSQRVIDKTIEGIEAIAKTEINKSINKELKKALNKSGTPETNAYGRKAKETLAVADTYNKGIKEANAYDRREYKELKEAGLTSLTEKEYMDAKSKENVDNTSAEFDAKLDEQIAELNDRAATKEGIEAEKLAFQAIALGDMKGIVGANTETLNSIKKNISRTLNEGNKKLKEKIKADVSRRDKLKVIFRKATAGFKKLDTTDIEDKKAQDERGFFGKKKDSILTTFDSIIKDLEASNFKRGLGDIYNSLMKGNNGWEANRTRELIDAEKIANDFYDAKTNILGLAKNNTKREAQEIYQDTKQDKTGVMVDGKEQKLSISEGHSIYAWSLQKDGMAKLENMGYTKESIEQVKEFIGEKGVKYMDWVVNDLLPNLKKKYNTSHYDIYNTDLGDIENYFPLKIDVANSTTVHGDGVNFSPEKWLSSTKSQHQKSRTDNIERLDIQSADAIINNYINSMEKFHHYSKFLRDANILLTDPETIQNIRNNNPNLEFQLRDRIATVVGANEGTIDSKFGKQFNDYTTAVALGHISLGTYTAGKQLVSAPVWLNVLKPKNWGKFVVAMATPRRNSKFLAEKSALYKERIKSRNVGDEDIKMLMAKSKVEKSMMSSVLRKFGHYKTASALDAASKNVPKYAIKWGMSANAMMDAVAISAGKAYYDQQLAIYKKTYSAKEADRRAIQDFNIRFNLTQQSSEAAFVSSVQEKKGVEKALFTRFMNSKFAYLRAARENIFDVKDGFNRAYDKAYNQEYKKSKDVNKAKQVARTKAYKSIVTTETAESLGRYAMFMHVMPAVWEYVSLGLPSLLTSADDDDGEKVVTAALMGGLSYFYGVGKLYDAASYAYWREGKVKKGDLDAMGGVLPEYVDAKLHELFKAHEEASTPIQEVLEYTLIVGKIAAELKLKIPMETLDKVVTGAMNIARERTLTKVDIERMLKTPNTVIRKDIKDSFDKKDNETLKSYKERVKKIEGDYGKRVTDADDEILKKFYNSDGVVKDYLNKYNNPLTIHPRVGNKSKFEYIENLEGDLQENYNAIRKTGLLSPQFMDIANIIIKDGKTSEDWNAVKKELEDMPKKVNGSRTKSGRGATGGRSKNGGR